MTDYLSTGLRSFATLFVILAILSPIYGIFLAGQFILGFIGFVVFFVIAFIFEGARRQLV